MTVTITRRIWITLESLAKDTRQSGNKQRETGLYTRGKWTQVETIRGGADTDDGGKTTKTGRKGTRNETW